MARANKIIWLPGGNGSSNPVYPFQQNDVDQIDVDKYLMQVACWAFGNSAAEFGIIPGEGLGGKGFMPGNAQLQMRSMVWPITGYLSSLFNLFVCRYLKRPDLKFQWVGLDPAPDQLQMAQVDQLYTQMGAYDLAYVQDRIGVPRQFRPAAPTPSASPQFPISQFANSQPANPYFTRAVKAELDTWREKAQRALKKGWTMPDFESEILPAEIMASVRAGLAKTASSDQINAAFEAAAPREGSGANAFFRYP